MLKIVTKLDRNLALSLENIYQESLNKGKLGSKSDFYDVLRNTLEYAEHTFFLWEDGGVLTTCVQAEKTDDGVLLYSLETAPEFRGKGYASNLLKSVLAYFSENSNGTTYVHIEKHNKISLSLHEKLGFRICKDSARLLDGTVSQSYYTLCL